MYYLLPNEEECVLALAPLLPNKTFSLRIYDVFTGFHCNWMIYKGMDFWSQSNSILSAFITILPLKESFHVQKKKKKLQQKVLRSSRLFSLQVSYWWYFEVGVFAPKGKRTWITYSKTPNLFWPVFNSPSVEPPLFQRQQVGTFQSWHII